MPEESVPPSSGSPPRSPSIDLASALSLDLSGSLPCVGCGYDLKGLSIVGTCPECGSPIAATLLQRVDPTAPSLVPLAYPRLTTLAMVVWAWCMVAFCVLVAADHIHWLMGPVSSRVRASVLLHLGMHLVLLVCALVIAIAASRLGLDARRNHQSLRRRGDGLWLAAGCWCWGAVVLLGLTVLPLLPLLSLVRSQITMGLSVLFAHALIIALAGLLQRPFLRSLAERGRMVERLVRDRQTLLLGLCMLAGSYLIPFVPRHFTGTARVAELAYISAIALILAVTLISFLRVAIDFTRLRSAIARGSVRFADVLSTTRAPASGPANRPANRPASGSEHS